MLYREGEGDGERARERERERERDRESSISHPRRQPTHTHRTHTETFHKLPTAIPQATHTHIKHIPKHPTGDRRQDSIPVIRESSRGNPQKQYNKIK